MAPRYTEAEAREAVAASRSYAEALRRMGMCDHGGSHKTLKKWVGIWGISTGHFLPPSFYLAATRKQREVPLDQVLVEGSTIGSSHLKKKLYRAGLKERRCELCGQGEEWRGRRMSLILDHVNGVRNDNRLENLRIVCPNCNATLDTHCGRNAALRDRACARCGAVFRPRYVDTRYCSRSCGAGGDRRGGPRPEIRKVERPPYEQVLADVELLGWEATGRKYGVSGNAVRKWVRWYEREQEREAA